MTHLYWIGLFVWCVGLAGFLAIASEDKKAWKLLFWIITFIGTVCYGEGRELLSQRKVFSNLAQEVDLQQVPVAEQKDFSAQIHIAYKDGKLDSVVLVPKTTVALKVDSASKTEQ